MYQYVVILEISQNVIVRMTTRVPRYIRIDTLHAILWLYISYQTYFTQHTPASNQPTHLHRSLKKVVHLINISLPLLLTFILKTLDSVNLHKISLNNNK
jgi:hypothetical protein